MSKRKKSELRTAACAWCGAQFAARNRQAKYCCAEHRHLGGRELARERDRKKRTAAIAEAKLPAQRIASIARAEAKARAYGLSYGQAVSLGII